MFECGSRVRHDVGHPYGRNDIDNPAYRPLLAALGADVRTA